MAALVATEEGTRTYWVQSLENCPIQQLTLAGICFPRHTAVRKEVRGEHRIVGYRPGAIVQITDAKAEKVRAAIDTHVARWRGKPNEFCKFGTKGDVLESRKARVKNAETGELEEVWADPSYAGGKPGDIPVAECVQFKLVEDTADAPAYFESEPIPYSQTKGPERKNGPRRRNSEASGADSAI